jgi:SAM-dependent methyltransferase
MTENILPALDLSDASSVFDWLYAAEDKAFSISYDERQSSNCESKDFTYGEVELGTFSDLLKIAKAKEGDIFYDLGSGSGKAVVTAALSCSFSKIYGVEILEGLYKLSKEICGEMKTLLTHNLKTEIEMINSNFFDVDFFDADIVYISSTCFSDDTMEQLEKKFLNLKPGARVIMLTKGLQSKDDFEQEYQELRKMGWGTCTVRIYRRK